MATDNESADRLQYHEAKGAADILDILRQELEQWVEEARDESEREALENVLGHLGSLEEEYKHRRDQLNSRLSG